MKKTIKFLVINFLIFFIVLEIILFIFKDSISTNILFYMPNTSLKNKLLIQNKMRTSYTKDEGDKIIFKKNDLSREISLPKETIYRKPDVQDIDFGAIDYFFYNDGFCNRNEKTNHKTFKLLAFGDSFTYCTFVRPEEAWVKQLQFRNEIYKKLNYGMTGTGLYEQIRLINEVLDNNSKIVISSIYEGNDLRDILKHFKQKSSNNKKKINHSKNNELKKIIVKLFGDSYTFNYLAAIKNIILFKLSNKENYNFRYKNTMNKIHYNINNIDQDEIIMAKKIYTEFYDYQTIKKYFSDPILDIKNKVTKNESVVVFIYIPSAHTSLGKNVIFEDKNVHSYLKKMSYVQRSVFKEICDQNLLNCIDVSENLIKSNNLGNVTHFPSNLHLTSKGHLIVSKSIDKFLHKIMN